MRGVSSIIELPGVKLQTRGNEHLPTFSFNTRTFFTPQPTQHIIFISISSTYLGQQVGPLAGNTFRFPLCRCLSGVWCLSGPFTRCTASVENNELGNLTNSNHIPQFPNGRLLVEIFRVDPQNILH